jgi:hypothetical protein
MRIGSAHAIAAAIVLAVQSEGVRAQCAGDDASLATLPQAEVLALVRSRFEAREYACAQRAARLYAGAAAKQPGEEAIDRRFALRNLTLDLVADTAHPVAPRMDLLRNAIATLAENGKTGGAEGGEEAKYDVLMLAKAGLELRNRQRDTGAWLDTLILAVRVDKKLPSGQRTLRKAWYVSELVPQGNNETRQYLDRLLTLAEETKGDPDFVWLRSLIAQYVNFYGYGWISKDSAEQVLQRAGLLIQLADSLADVQQCYGCGQNWYWMPIMRAGVAYHRLGMAEPAAKNVERAMNLAKGIEDPNRRLGEYRFVLTELLAAQYDRKVVRELLREMQALADSLDTPIGKEMRESLPRTIKKWGLEAPG